MTEDIRKRQRKLRIIVYGGLLGLFTVGSVVFAVANNAYDGIAQTTKNPTQQRYAKKAIEYEKKNIDSYYPNAKVTLDSINEYPLTKEQLREQVPACRSIPKDHFNEMYDAAYRYEFKLFYETGANGFWDGILSLGHNNVIASHPKVSGCELYKMGVETNLI